MVALPAGHPAAKSPRVDLRQLCNESLILTPRGVWQTLFDTVIATCREAGFEPALGQPAPNMGSVINLVAAGLGYSLVPASLRQVQVTGVAYREIEGLTPVAKLALASRRGETSDIVRNFMARAGQSARDNTLQLRVWRSQALHSRRKTIDAAPRQEPGGMSATGRKRPVGEAPRIPWLWISSATVKRTHSPGREDWFRPYGSCAKPSDSARWSHYLDVTARVSVSAC